MADKSTHIYVATVQHGIYKGKLRIVECRESPLHGTSRCNYIGDKVVGVVDTPAMAIAARDTHAKENNLAIAPFGANIEEHALA